MIEQKVAFYTDSQGHVMLGRQMNAVIAAENANGWFVTHLAVDSINGALLASVLFQRGDVGIVVDPPKAKKAEGFKV